MGDTSYAGLMAGQRGRGTREVHEILVEGSPTHNRVRIHGVLSDGAATDTFFPSWRDGERQEDGDSLAGRVLNNPVTPSSPVTERGPWTVRGRVHGRGDDMYHCIRTTGRDVESACFHRSTIEEMARVASVLHGGRGEGEGGDGYKSAARMREEGGHVIEEGIKAWNRVE